MRHAQFPAATPGVFIRAALSSLSTSCIGITAVRAQLRSAIRAASNAGSAPLLPQ
jgi:hypothetical protein